MPTYYYYNNQGKQIFEVSYHRMDDIMNFRNMHPHRRNDTRHRGRGNNEAPPTGGAALALYNMGEMLTTLPNTENYWEYVWNEPGLPAGMTRVIVGSGGSLWITWDHYSVYHRVHQAEQARHIVF